MGVDGNFVALWRNIGVHQAALGGKIWELDRIR